jgi:membrane-bound inhibitor of C-type lysozyme
MRFPGVVDMPTSLTAGRAKPARLWHAVTALALVAGVVFFTRAPQTDAAGGLPFDCGGRHVELSPEGDGALLTAGTQVFELHRIRTASGARYDAPEDPSGTFFWDKGDVATVVVQGDTYPECRRVR